MNYSIKEVPEMRTRTLFVAALLTLLVAGFVESALAQNTDPWQNFLDILINWIIGNLGKFIALIIMFVASLIAAFTHSARPLAWGIILAIVIGGLVGITNLFFSAGQQGFGTNF